MVRSLRGTRYAEGASPTFLHAITERLPYTSFREAEFFYDHVTLDLCTPKEMALLGCNDRYYLLTRLLNRPDAVHPWLYERAREVESDPDGHLDLWARGHYKSTLITFAGIIQEVLIDPEIKIAIFSNNKKLAQPFLEQIQTEFEVNDVLKDFYPDVLWDEPEKQAPKWSKNDGLVVKRKSNPKEATIEAWGLIDGQPTGKHYDLMDFDDVITEKNVTNPDQIKKATEQIELADNLGTIEGSRKWYVGTRYSFADTYGAMLEREMASARIYPATANGKLDGEPVMFSEAVWAEKKKQQRSTIAAQLLINPLAGKENTFRTEWLRPYELLPYCMNVYILGDPSRGRNKTSDRTALVVIGIDTLGNKYLLEGYCHRMTLSQRWFALRRLWLKWNEIPGVQRVEVGYERYGQQSDDEYFEEQMRLKGPVFEIKEVAWTGERGRESKEYRVERMEPDFQQSRFFVPARVWHAGLNSDVRWSIENETWEILYEPNLGLSKLERRAKNNNESWRIRTPIRRRDEDKDLYDLTRIFFEEYRFFPFSPRDDLVDAMSRIYDMDPLAATMHEKTYQMANHPDA
jgi:hypothetical protein